ncbi:Uncharacterised protein [Mycobacterium tuberculosis]|uniref:Uncharacterized protein n=1 Tax=Mycobacterium tuberculosis TaxID=1773 RepID=A0A654TR61_MYCTX|nr:Uncharacterised protein [Mycobacterium tuberculosis]CFS02506.1 Uncharacterised protein [Mycobacterium tuberculosis]
MSAAFQGMRTTDTYDARPSGSLLAGGSQIGMRPSGWRSRYPRCHAADAPASMKPAFWSRASHERSGRYGSEMAASPGGMNAQVPFTGSWTSHPMRRSSRMAESGSRPHPASVSRCVRSSFVTTTGRSRARPDTTRDAHVGMRRSAPAGLTTELEFTPETILYLYATMFKLKKSLDLGTGFGQ